MSPPTRVGLAQPAPVKTAAGSTAPADALRISVIIPVHNSADYLRECLTHLQAATVEHECIVVDDCSTDQSAAVAQQFGATVLKTDRRSGPARARNLGARAATGDLLFFIDADVCVHSDTLRRIQEDFQRDAELDALIGSYDDSPPEQDFLSQYRNLMHSFVHQHGRQRACTFWSGCGAIRRLLFLKHSGFDESYDRPAIEDIELGYRLARAQHKLVLDPELQVKHLKAWSFLSLLKTDILDRGIPWTELILRDRRMPNDLNLQLSQRVSVALVFLLLAIAAIGVVYAWKPVLLALLALLFLSLCQFEVEATWKLQPKVSVAVALLVPAIVVMSYLNGTPWLVPPVVLAYAMLFLRHRYAYRGARRRKMTGIACGAYLLLMILFVITYLPYHPLVFCFFLLLSAVVALNSQFYVFLALLTGRLLMVAAIPFHLLFHFYNGLSFLIGLARHTFWRIFPK